jgi:molecular chaperone DnaK (HSP70)
MQIVAAPYLGQTVTPVIGKVAAYVDGSWHQATIVATQIVKLLFVGLRTEPTGAWIVGAHAQGLAKGVILVHNLGSELKHSFHSRKCPKMQANGKMKVRKLW